jgi:hypothetical protein
MDTTWVPGTSTLIVPVPGAIGNELVPEPAGPNDDADPLVAPKGTLNVRIAAIATVAHATTSNMKPRPANDLVQRCDGVIGPPEEA